MSRRQQRVTGVLHAYCINCLSEWQFDMEQRPDGAWQAIEPDERLDFDRCPECKASLTFGASVLPKEEKVSG